MDGQEDEVELYEWSWSAGAAADRALALQWDLAHQLADREPVFLDTRFWIWAREAAFDDVVDEKLISFLGALRLAVQSGRAFFPVTADLIEEFSKQTPECFAQTMHLVDHLSLGVALVPVSERNAIEIEALLAQAHPAHPPVPRPVWTKAVFAFGYEDLRPKGVEIGDKVLIELTERAWRAKPSEVAATYPTGVFDAKGESERLAVCLKEQERLHEHEIDTYATAVRYEVAGATSMITGIAAREFRRLARAYGMLQLAEDVEASRKFGREMGRIMSLALQQDENRRKFPSLYIQAALHAAVRSRKGQVIKPNDLFDFRHAAAALPYCKAFFTERPLRSLITSGHMRLDTLYGCKVMHTVEDAIAWLGDLVIDRAG